jgi:hypothetical protein
VICSSPKGRFQISGLKRIYSEEVFDYGNQLGVSGGCIAGLKKTIYNSADFSTIAVSAAHSAASESNNGR